MNNNWQQKIDDLISNAEYTCITKDLRNTWISTHHNHNRYELHLILQGSCVLEVAGNMLHLNGGQAIIICPGVFHCNMSHSEPFTRLSIAFKMDEMDQLQGTTQDAYFLFPITPTVLRICYDAFDEVDLEPSGWMSSDMLSHLLAQLLILTFRSIQKNTLSPGPITTEKLMLSTIDLFFSLPLEPVEKDYSRKSLAKLLHCSERQLNRLIYKMYGITFQQKRLLARMDYAKFLLRNTDKTITEICELVGYSDNATFHKFFKSQCQMTPNEFRNSYKNP